MFKKATFKNGLRIITFPMKNTQALTLLVLVGTGSKYEKKEINGISHLLEHMAFKGTKKRPKTQDIAKELDMVGGIFNAFTDKELIGFWVKVNATHFNLATDVLSDMIFNSLFKEGEIKKGKRVILEEINMMKDNPSGYILELWEKLLYGDQPAGWMIAGEKETLKKISRKDILSYFKNQFAPTNVVISLAGDFREKEAVSKIKHFFGKFKKTKPFSKKTTIERQKIPQVLLNFKKTDQTHLCLGVRTYNLFRPERYLLAVIAVLLGGIMSSRLFIQVREKRGLAYYIRTSSKHYTDTGYLVTHAGIDNKKVKDAIKIILKEYKNLKTKKISKEELKKAKDNIKGRLYLGLETSDAWASYLGGQEILRRKILTPEKECAKIDKISQNDILKVAKEIFQPQKLNLALIGPFKEKEKFKKILKL
ncbi:insulinase family protein [Patescibacteria group bacterium]|nr:insulinase family protein [Patescibacteria group bacterium]